MSTINYLVVMPIVVLAVLLALAVIVLWRAQKRADFDIANMLKNDEGKESALRLGVLVSLAISSWGIVFLLMNDKAAEQYWFVYLATWSGSLVFIKLADRWDGVLPWTSTK